MSDSSPPRARKGFQFGIVFLVVLVLGIIAYRAKRSSDYKAEIARLKSLIELKNEGIARLENGEHNAAIEIFEKISTDLPDEPLGLQNLAIARFLKLSETDQLRDKEVFDPLLKELRETIGLLQHKFTVEAVGFALAGRLEESQRNFELARTQYLKAHHLASTPTPVMLYLGCRIVRDYEQKLDRSVIPKLQEALHTAPRNAALILTLLRECAVMEDSSFFKILDQKRDVFRLFTSRTSQIVPKLYDQAEQAAREGDWETAGIQLRQIGTILLGEVTYTQDLARLDPHSLEWIRHDFSNKLYEKYPELREVSENRIEVRFDGRQPALTQNGSVRAIHSEDSDLDGRRELFYATDKSLFVVAFDAEGTPKPILETELPFEANGIRTADLDRDFVRTDANVEPADSGQESASSFRDTDLDVMLFGEAGLRLYRNDLDESGARSLAAVPQPEGIDLLEQVAAVEAVDLDHDGDLDLIVSSKGGITLWSNRGNWTFENISEFSDLPDDQKRAIQLLPIDIERNGLIDVALAIPESHEGLFLANNLHGQFATRSFSDSNMNLGDCRQVCSLDSNRDGKWDLASVGDYGTRVSFGSSFLSGDKTEYLLSEVPASGIATCDYDNDGMEDLVSWGSGGLQIFRGSRSGAPELQAQLTESFPKNIADVAIADFDADGDQDLAVLSEGEVTVFTNQGGNTNHWLDLVIRAEAKPQNARERCNMHGIGSLIECKAGELYQAQTVRQTSVHFGLGARTQADVLRVLWTNGIPHNVIGPKGGQIIFEQQNLGGSCPYLYTWNGERFVFYTDCLWAAPIGLQFAQGVLAPFREWEYLKIDGEFLKPRKNEYVLQITEELWEAAYFDSVKLLAVDHPAEIEVYTNEKVGPAEIAQFEVHTVTHKKRPNHVIDQTGRDVSEVATKRDGNFTRSWEKSLNQGLTETHWLELDLGDFPPDASVTLFMTGWVFPASTSLNIAIAQNPDKPKPMPPQVLVPDENGNWVTAIESMGFPGGKTKTIAVDLSEIFPTNDHRVRIATNMEICWDDVFYTIDEPEAEYRLTELELLGADLHYRGFSARVPRGGNNHKDFDYNRVTAAPQWVPMGGRFTRYGDVTELLVEADDCSAVLGSGDEMTVRFSIPESELLPGWKRDFILYNIGWDKDADFNTVQGQQVEPLPFRAMTRYPYGPDESFPDSLKHREYLKTFQTRQLDVRQFRTQIRDWISDR